MSGPSIKLVAIGASAGAVQALLQILPGLPAGYAFPILIVVHVPPERDNALISLLAPRCRVRVNEAEDKETPAPGTIYFAPSDYHLLLEPDGSLSLSSDEPVNYSRPSIDVLLESAADALGEGLCAIVLTGANSDGAVGLKAVADKGGVAIVEDPDNAYAPTMPNEALRLSSSASVMSLDKIASYLLGLVAS